MASTVSAPSRDSDSGCPAVPGECVWTGDDSEPESGVTVIIGTVSVTTLTWATGLPLAVARIAVIIITGTDDTSSPCHWQ